MVCRKSEKVEPGPDSGKNTESVSEGCWTAVAQTNEVRKWGSLRGAGAAGQDLKR